VQKRCITIFIRIYSRSYYNDDYAVVPSRLLAHDALRAELHLGGANFSFVRFSPKPTPSYVPGYTYVSYYVDG